ncbi:MAG TPA: prepilin-type N-terminal cleavage/methylation domain-containing protein [Syntrophales bacterium]|nr:prepilin-type N-terminal cleavage/methylation domain-containing protein [Syntrophales bacterium]
MIRRDFCQGKRKDQSGFTLIEVITVLIVLGILVAVTATRLSGVADTAQDTSDIDRLKSHLRYAQIRALNTVGVWGIDFSGTGYNLYRDGDATVYSFPGEENSEMEKPSSVTYSGYISFDEWGRPYTSQGTGTPLTTTPGGLASITITPETGYIP